MKRRRSPDSAAARSMTYFRLPRSQRQGVPSTSSSSTKGMPSSAAALARPSTTGRHPVAIASFSAMTAVTPAAFSNSCSVLAGSVVELAGTCRARLSSAPAPPPPKSMQVVRALVARGKCRAVRIPVRRQRVKLGQRVLPQTSHQHTAPRHPLHQVAAGSAVRQGGAACGAVARRVTCSSPTSSLPLHLLLSVRSLARVETTYT